LSLSLKENCQKAELEVEQEKRIDSGINSLNKMGLKYTEEMAKTLKE
jgi:hypothetical protein